MKEKNTKCYLKDQLEENGVCIDAKWAFNPVKVYAPQRQRLMTYMQSIDSVEACNRFKWIISSKFIPKQFIEQYLYRRSALMMYKEGKEYRLLPFVANGKLNLYGFFTKVKPIPFNSKVTQKNYDNYEAAEYEVYNYEDDKGKKAVILYDRIDGFTRTNGPIPTIDLQQTIIREIVNRLSFLNINLVNSQGKNIILVKDPKQASVVNKALENVYASDKSFSIVKSKFDVQVINNEIEYKEQQLWEDIMSWNNLRLQGLGINNNGLFNKKERLYSGESDSNDEQTDVITDAYFEARKLFIKQCQDCFGDDPDFQEQFKEFDVIDLRVEQKKKEQKEQEKQDEEEEDDDNDNFMFWWDF